MTAGAFVEAAGGAGGAVVPNSIRRGTVGLAVVSPVMVTGVPLTCVHFQAVALVEPLPSRVIGRPRAAGAVVAGPAMIAVGVAAAGTPPAGQGPATSAPVGPVVVHT